jgi:hypothetical protein
LVSAEEKNNVEERASNMQEFRGLVSLLVTVCHPSYAVATLAMQAPLSLTGFAAVSPIKSN